MLLHGKTIGQQLTSVIAGISKKKLKLILEKRGTFPKMVIIPRMYKKCFAE